MCLVTRTLLSVQFVKTWLSWPLTSYFVEQLNPMLPLTPPPSHFLSNNSMFTVFYFQTCVYLLPFFLEPWCYCSEWQMWRINVTNRKKLVKIQKTKGPLALPSCISCLLYPLLCFQEYHGIIDLHCLVYFKLLILVLVSDVDKHGSGYSGHISFKMQP